MRPNKTGQIARYHTPYPQEDPNQLYIVLDAFEDTDRPRAHIKALFSGMGSFTPINTVSLDDLEVVGVDTSDLLGHVVNITKPDKSRVKGEVVKIKTQENLPDLVKTTNGVETNVWITIRDKYGEEHSGTLFVN